MNAATTGATTMVYGAVALLIFLMIGMLVCIALTVLGNVFCMSAPEAAGARILAIVSLSLLIAYLVLQIGSVLIRVFSLGFALAMSDPGVLFAQHGLAGIVGLIGTVAGFAHIIVFQLLLRALAQTLRRDGLAGAILAMMIVGAVAVVVQVAMAVIALTTVGTSIAMGPSRASFNNMSAGFGMTAALGCLFLVLMLTWIIWYIISLFMVRAAISDKIG
jgi:hypothetical protein